MTGYSIGGIPPIGHPGPVRAIMDPDLGRYPVVWAAAGLPTAVFPLPPATLQALANATMASIAGGAAADRDGVRRRGAAWTCRGRRGGRWRAPSLATPPSPTPAASALDGAGAAAAQDRRCSRSARAAVRSIDFGTRVAEDPDALCRAELRLEGPRGAWTARFASLIHDEPRGLLWDTRRPARRRLWLPYLRARGRDRRGALGPPLGDAGGRADRFLHGSPTSSSSRSSRRSRSSRTARSRGGSPTRDVVTAAELVGGRLVLTSFGGQVSALDPATGRAAA